MSDILFQRQEERRKRGEGILAAKLGYVAQVAVAAEQIAMDDQFELQQLERRNDAQDIKGVARRMIQPERPPVTRAGQWT